MSGSGCVHWCEGHLTTITTSQVACVPQVTGTLQLIEKGPNRKMTLTQPEPDVGKWCLEKQTKQFPSRGKMVQTKSLPKFRHPPTYEKKNKQKTRPLQESGPTHQVPLRKKLVQTTRSPYGKNWSKPPPPSRRPSSGTWALTWRASRWRLQGLCEQRALVPSERPEALCGLVDCAQAGGGGGGVGEWWGGGGGWVGGSGVAIGFFGMVQPGSQSACC